MRQARACALQTIQVSLWVTSRERQCKICPLQFLIHSLEDSSARLLFECEPLWNHPGETQTFMREFYCQLSQCVQREPSSRAICCQSAESSRPSAPHCSLKKTASSWWRALQCEEEFAGRIMREEMKWETARDSNRLPVSSFSFVYRIEQNASCEVETKSDVSGENGPVSVSHG